MKIAIVMTYYDRQIQLTRTLLSIRSKHKDFEVIIVDDNSPESIILPCVNYPIYVHRFTHKTWTNPEPAYNTGIEIALRRGADIIIVQNAECYHVGDVIERASKLTDADYITFACFSIDERNTHQKHDIHAIISENNHGATGDGQCAWYNHPVHRPVGYDFAAAMTANTMLELNGYDERFSDGMAYGDDYLIARVGMLGLNTQIVVDPFVVHQWHYNGKGVPENKAELVMRNRRLFCELINERNPRAKHIMTNDFERIIDKSMGG